jgi:cytochrome c-type biogenesis protein CcmH
MTTRIRTWAGLAGILVAPACSDGRAADTRAQPAPAALETGAPSTRTLPAGHPPVTATQAEGSVSGTVIVAPSLSDAARDGRVLFLIARAGKDRQIVAVKRVDELTFPRAFELSPQDAMSHGTPFAGPLEITARLSRSGDAAPGSGDLEGVTAGVAPGAHDIRIELRTVRP